MNGVTCRAHQSGSRTWVAGPQVRFWRRARTEPSVHAHSQDHTGVRIARLRRARHLTQAQLADLAGLSVSIISKIEQGREPAMPFVIAQVATVLRVDMLEAAHRRLPNSFLSCGSWLGPVARRESKHASPEVFTPVYSRYGYDDQDRCRDSGQACGLGRGPQHVDAGVD
ncbi:helix-turn-helix domain-containing protein [Streptomyces sp. NPDC017964]|uniref:helix-turn-helix domain-containing protein n=1 Tax=Streptomyces sp. NPDC017964 TaxID=3365022 RepID=UPI0037A1C153